MKSRKMRKKLNLNKPTVSVLNAERMEKVYGASMEPGCTLSVDEFNACNQDASYTGCGGCGKEKNKTATLPGEETQCVIYESFPYVCLSILVIC